MLERQPIAEETARFYIAIMLWALVVEIMTALMFFEIPASNREIMIGLGGTIVGALVGSANFYNKSGLANDRQKDDTIHKSVALAAAQAAAASGTADAPGA